MVYVSDEVEKNKYKQHIQIECGNGERKYSEKKKKNELSARKKSITNATFGLHYRKWVVFITRANFVTLAEENVYAYEKKHT